MKLAALPTARYAGLAVDDLGRPDARPPLVLLHGLTLDRTMWRPALAELETIDPGRRAIAIDLPGHGDSPDAPSYGLEALVDRVHAAVEDAGLGAPVVVGHSAAAGTAFLYGVMHPSRGVVAVEGTLRVGPFAVMAKSIEPVLRGPGFDVAFGRVLANTFGLDEVSPEVRDFVIATSRPRQHVVLGSWQALFELSPQELDAMVAQGAAAIRASGLPFVSVVGHDPSPEEIAWIAANMPGMRIEVWPRSGHFPHIAHPLKFAELLAETATWPIRAGEPVGAGSTA
jgi:pimeloyl-ACP methyl ester carboxylesterase